MNIKFRVISNDRKAITLLQLHRIKFCPDNPGLPQQERVLCLAAASRASGRIKKLELKQGYGKYKI